MTIRELKEILNEAPNENAEVFIDGFPRYDDHDSYVAFDYDDNNNLDLFIVK